MTDKEKKILLTFIDIVPKLDEKKREKLLAFGEGMAFMVNRQVK